MTSLESGRLINFLASMPGLGHDVIDREEVRLLMRSTGGQIMANGGLWDITVKPVGAGVYRVSTKRWTP